jgi:hypothetical protein
MKVFGPETRVPVNVGSWPKVVARIVVLIGELHQPAVKIEDVYAFKQFRKSVLDIRDVLPKNSRGLVIYFLKK